MRSASLVLLLACAPERSAPPPVPAASPIEVTPVAMPPPAIAAPAVPPPVTTAERAALATQLLRGGQLYTEHCASCHGDAGEGTEDGPPVVGESVLPRHAPAGAKRTAEFRSAADVYAFTRANMPADDPGTLPPDDYLAIVAFALTANGVSLDRAIDVDVARTIVLHR